MRLWGWLQKRCALRAWYYVLPGVKCIVSGESVLCVCIGECGAILPIRAIGVAQRTDTSRRMWTSSAPRRWRTWTTRSGRDESLSIS